MKENKSTSIKDIIIGIVLIAFIGSIGIWFLMVFLKFLAKIIIQITQITSNMDVVVIVALITGGVSISGVVISSIVSKIIEYRQTTKRYLYEKKEEPYSDFIEMVYKIQDASRENTEYPEEKMLEDILSFSKKLTLWGSSKVIKKWLAFRETSKSNNSDSTDNLFILEEIIFEIRKDMGQKRRGLKQGDILAFFIKDIKEYLPKDK